MQCINGEKKSVTTFFYVMDDRYRSSAPVCKVDKQCVKNEKKVEKRIKMLQSRREGSIRLLFLNKGKKEKRKKKHRNEKEGICCGFYFEAEERGVGKLSCL
jgi:hypothetical protein